MPLTLNDYLEDFNGRSMWDRVSRSAEERALEEQRLRMKDFGRRLERARRLIEEATKAEPPQAWIDSFRRWAPARREA